MLVKIEKERKRKKKREKERGGERRRDVVDSLKSPQLILFSPRNGFIYIEA
jgi:hypothetical protein